MVEKGYEKIARKYINLVSGEGEGANYRGGMEV